MRRSLRRFCAKFDNHGANLKNTGRIFGLVRLRSVLAFERDQHWEETDRLRLPCLARSRRCRPELARWMLIISSSWRAAVARHDGLGCVSAVAGRFAERCRRHGVQSLKFTNFEQCLSTSLQHWPSHAVATFGPKRTNTGQHRPTSGHVLPNRFEFGKTLPMLWPMSVSSWSSAHQAAKTCSEIRRGRKGFPRYDRR